MKIKKINIYYIIVLVFYILISSLFVHNDLLDDAFQSNQLALGHLDIYNWFSSQNELNSMPTPMLPLYYLVYGGYIFVLKLLHIDPVSSNITNLSLLFGQFGGLKYALGVLLLKLPHIILILLAAIILKKIANIRGYDNRAVQLLWIASPLLISGSLMQANMDVFPAFFAIVSLYFMAKNKYFIGMIMLGISAGFKDYTLLLVLPIAIIISNKKLKKILIYLVCAGISYFIIIAPFINKNFIHRVLDWHESSFILNNTIQLGMSPIYIFILLYMIFVVYLYYKKSYLNKEFEYILWASLTIIDLIFITSPWLPQWLIWILPYSALLFAKSRKKIIYFILSSAIIIISNVLLFPNNLDANMLRIWLPNFNSFLSYTEFVSAKLIGVYFTLMIVLLIWLIILSYPDYDILKEGELNASVRNYAFVIPIGIYLLIIFVQPLIGQHIFENDPVLPLNNVGPIISKNVIKQEFSTNMQSFNQIKIYEYNYQRQNSSILQVFIGPKNGFNNSKRLIANLSTANLPESSWITFKFRKIFPTYNKYVVEITSSGNNIGNAVTMWESEASPTGTSLFIDGKRINGCLVMQVNNVNI